MHRTDRPVPPTPTVTPTAGADDNPGGPMEFNNNGITYDIRVDRAECDRRLGHLLAALSRPVIARRAVCAEAIPNYANRQEPPPTPADGAEIQSDRSHEPAPASPSQPRFPVRVTWLTPSTGTSFLPCGTDGGVGDTPIRKGVDGPTIEFSKPGNRETAKKRPPR